MITDFDPEAEQKCFVMVRENKADGVIALTYSPELAVDDGLPVVTIDRHLGCHVPCVSSDNYGGGEIAAEKLYALCCFCASDPRCRVRPTAAAQALSTGAVRSA